MTEKPTYEELKQRVSELEREKEERLRAEAALKESEKEKALILDSITDHIFFYGGPKMDIVWTNKAAIKDSGLPEKEFLNTPCYKIWWKRDVPCDNCPKQQVIDTGQPYQTQLNTPDGRWWNIRCSPVSDESGKLVGVVQVSCNITDRVQTQALLEESEKKYRTIFENAVMGIYQTGIDGEVLMLNEKCAEIFGYESPKQALEAVGNVRDVFARPEDRSDLIARINKKGFAKNEEIELKKRNGDLFRANLNVIKDEEKNGRTVFTGILEDVTDLRRAEEDLRSSEEKYRRIFNAAPIGICHYDQNGLIEACNPQFAEMAGSSVERLVGLNMLADLENPHFIKAIRDSLSGNPVHTEGKYTSITGGKTIYARMDCIPIGGDGKTIAGGICVVEDTTKKIKAEKALRKREAEARALLNATTDAAILLDPEGIIRDINDAYARRFDKTTEQMLGTCIWGYFPPGVVGPRKRNVSQVFESGKSVTMVDERQGMWNYTNIYPVFDPAGRVARVAVFAHDITQRKKAEDELIKSREQLRSLSAHLQTVLEQERKGIAREIHDDLGQVLTAVKMDAAWLKEKIPKDEKALIEKAAIIVEIADQAIRSVQKISSRLRPAVLDDLGLVAAIEWMAKGCQNRTGIVFDVRIDPEEMDVSPETATAAFRIFQEAVTNIARHSKATQVKVRLKLKKNHIELIVSDNGIGITGWQVSDREAFGLLGMRERARAIGGEIKISGIPGKGTEVSVNIPADG